jgi:hypothetical protein
LREVGRRLDRQIDGAVDRADAGASLARAAVCDHVEEFSGRGRAMPRVAAAACQNLALGANIGDDTVPFVEHRARRHRLNVQSERLCGHRRLHRMLGRVARRRRLRWALRQIVDSREATIERRHLVRSWARLRLGECTINQNGRQQRKQHGDAVHNATEHFDVPVGRSVAPVWRSPCSLLSGAHLPRSLLLPR